MISYVYILKLLCNRDIGRSLPSLAGVLFAKLRTAREFNDDGYRKKTPIR